MNKNFFLSLVCLCLLVIGCNSEQKENIDQGEPVITEKYNYSKLSLPQGLLRASDVFTGNGGPVIIDVTTGGGIFNNGIPVENFNNFVNVTDAGAQLGRVLFYDKKLSLNNTIACASCHHQDKAFSDGLAVSSGFEGRKTSRNSMAIINPISQNNLFWDSRSQSIKDLSLRPIQNHIEMGMEDIDFLVKKLTDVPYYKNLFSEAFGDSQITKDRISDAISQFIGSITTSNSKFDAVMLGNSSFNELEQLGFNTFFSAKAKCSSCHAGGNFSAPDGIFDPYGGGGSVSGENPRGTANIGLDLVEKDKGKENGQFKIPSLRNITLTAPYMHDGRFNTLEEVLNHYTHGIKANKNLDPKFKDNNGSLVAIKLNDLEKKGIIAFLQTLTDDTYTKDPKYSDPFKN
jgi:cytochrome c peroxidase